MVTIKKSELPGIMAALGELLNGEKQPDGTVKRHGVPPKAGYWLGRIFRDIVPHQERLEADRADLIRQLGTEEDGSFSIRPDDEAWSEFVPLITALFAETVECAHTVKLSDLGDDPAIGGLVAVLGDLVTNDVAE